MKLTALFAAASIAAVISASAGTSSIYFNNGTVNTPISIDASNFVNNGIFDIFTTSILPYSTSNTRNYTNNGSMLGVPGFRFDTAPSGTGVRTMAQSFYNGPMLANGFGTIEAVGTPSYLMVLATNIWNRGSLNVGAGGLLQLIGTNINVSRSSLLVVPISGVGSTTLTNLFFPENGVFDNYWAQTNMTFFSSEIYDDTFATTPEHNVQPVLFSPQQFSVLSPYPDGYGFDNALDPSTVPMGIFITTTNSGPGPNPGTNSVFVQTNHVIQAVFLQNNNDPRTTVNVTFSRRTATNLFRTVSVEFSQMTTNAATGGTNVSSVYFVDSLASDPVRGLRVNNVTGNTFRPVSYLISRVPPFVGFDPQPENFDPSSTDIWNPTYGDRVTGAYAAYSASIENLTSRPVVGDPVTNLPGRIYIKGDVVDLSRTRMHAEGLLTVEARHLVGSSNAVVDSENMNYTLGSTNGIFVMKDMVRQTVSRVRGTIRAWSGVWNNTNTVYSDSYVSNNVDGTFNVFSPVPTSVPIGIHVLILDASTLDFQTPVPVLVYNLTLTSTNGTGNTIIYDPMTIYKKALFDTFALTLNTNLNFSLLGPLQSWTAGVAPRLRYFTNNGSLGIPSDAHFGDDRPPYDTFYNHGSISSVGQTIGATNIIVNGGLNFASGGLTWYGNVGNFIGASLFAGSDIDFEVRSLYFTNSTLNATGKIIFGSTNSLLSGTVTNGSYSSVNFFTTGNGFVLPSKPATSDLLGTTIESDVPSFAQVDHIWSGKDIGAVKAGFSNNAAIGKLTLVNGDADPFFQPLLYFSGTGASNALYVDDLDLSQLAGTTNVLGFNTNMIIYFAYSEGVPADILNGACDGHLRWVTNYVGPYSATNSTHDGTNLFPVNRGLVEASTIDSDGDTTPNGSDPTPFDGVPLNTILKIKLAQPAQQQQTLNAQSGVEISWFAVGGGVYQVQYSTNMPTVLWLPLIRYTNGVLPQTVTITDKPPTGTPRRYYRVGWIKTP